MLKKLLFMAVVLMAAVAFGQPNLGTVYHEVEVVDEEGIRITNISSVDIYLEGTTTSATIYMSPQAVGAIDLPMTSVSTNTTLSSGTFYWWGPAGYDFSITDGTNTHTNYGFRARTASEGRISFPSYLHAASTTSWTDAQSITLGDSSDWVINAGTTDDLLTFTPASDGAVFRVGLANGTKSADLQWYTASGVGLIISESSNTFGITGLTTNINVSSNYATNINTGSSTGDVNILNGTGTGAVDIGSSASGAWSIDGTSTGTLVSDAAMSITTTDGSADITVDATAGSLNLAGGEAAVDAVTIVSAGGMDVTLADDFDFSLVSGASDENMSFVLSGATASSIILTSSGTGADALDINTSAGGIDIDIVGAAAGEDFNVTTNSSFLFTSSEAATDQFKVDATGAAGAAQGFGIVLETTGTGIQLNADGTAYGDISVDAADTLALIAAGTTSTAMNVDITGTAGGFDLDTTDGAVAVTAGGAANGDVTITAGDDLTLAVTGSAVLGKVGYDLQQYAYHGNASLSTSQSGMVIMNWGDGGSQIFGLPAGQAGLIFTFVDVSATAGDDLTILPAASDMIIGHTADKYLTEIGDAAPAYVTLYCVDAGTWVILSEAGTWARSGQPN